MTSPDPALLHLEGLYDRVVSGTSQSVEELLRHDRVSEMCECYGKRHFVRLPDIAPRQALTEIASILKPLLEPLFEPVVVYHEETADGLLGYGSRFNRLDPGLVYDPAIRERLQALFVSIGVMDFGTRLSTCLMPLMRTIVGDVEWRRIYLYLYRQGDYVGVHDDSHVGNRIDVQFPVCVGGTGGIRVLSGNLLEMQVDATGTANILGSNMWHDVPPFVRTGRSKDAFRLNFGLRFVPPGTDGAGKKKAASPSGADRRWTR